jgi:hypothetical protein
MASIAVPETGNWRALCAGFVQPKEAAGRLSGARLLGLADEIVRAGSLSSVIRKTSASGERD